MEYNNKIDVIIPIYNIDDRMLIRCLSSIASQNIIDDVTISVVNDASTNNNYKKIIEQFKPLMDIQLFELEKNSGPGVARQYALDRTVNEFIAFIDADDTFDNAFALQKLRYAMTMGNNEFQMVVGFFREVFDREKEHPDELKFLDHQEDMVWLFGKLYRREVIEKFDIRFHPTSRANEDAGFNGLMQMCLQHPQVNFIEDFLYYWQDNPNSLTRFNDYKYAHDSSKNASFYGYVENMIFAVNHAKKVNPKNIDYINFYGSRVMHFLYTYYLECCEYAPEDAKRNLEYCKMYYNEIYKESSKYVDEEHFKTSHMDAMIQFYNGHLFSPIIPHITFQQFIDLCKEDYIHYEED